MISIHGIPTGAENAISREAQRIAGGKVTALPCPTESQEQQALFEWAGRCRGRCPELGLLYHIPNEGRRTHAAGRRLKSEGLRRGVPDLCLPVARGGRHGLYIELKRRHGGRTSEDQRGWLQALEDQGYAAALCKGWEDAARVIADYLSGAHAQEE